MPQTTASLTDNLTNTARDAAYVTIGLGVIAFQQAQVRRQELIAATKSRLDAGRGSFDSISDTLGEAVEDRIKLVEERLEGVETRIDALLDDVAARLPEQAQDVLSGARQAARDARSQVRDLVTRAS